MSPGLVACFSGHIGSGKSSVTHVLAQALQWKRAGFGDYVRTRVREQGGNPDSREALQDLGQKLVESDPDAFCRAVLTSGGFSPGENFLLDGIRHVDIYRRVQRLVAPSRTVLIHLSVDEVKARRRVASRDGSVDDLERARAHRVEADVQESLPAIADLIVDAAPTVDGVAAEILNAIRRWRHSNG
jgi:dephospho-CoA kinase